MPYAQPDRNREFQGTERFQVVRRIGAGGIGLVFEAIDREHQSRVAIKTLQRLEGDAILRFKNEFRMLQGLHHRNLVRLGELFEVRGEWFFTMELLRGVDFMTYVAPSPRLDMMSQRIDRPALGSADEVTQTSSESHVSGRGPRRNGMGSSGSGDQIDTRMLGTSQPQRAPSATPTKVLDPDAAPRHHRFDEHRLRSTLRQLALGLEVLHNAGKVHRDIKPQNVMVTEGGRLVLLDFGLVSEQTGKDSLEHGMVLGTPAYMAPEQAAGEPITPASDWYGVGVMLYEALVGIRPFVGGPSQIMLAKQTMDPNPPSRLSPSVPADLDELCMQLLSRTETRRPLSQGVLAALAEPDESDPSGAIPRARIPRARSELNRLSVPLIGREALLEVLGGAFDRRDFGRPQALFVHGSSGMGKTMLIDRFADSLDRHNEDVLTFRGRCYERESVPYKAFDGIIDELARFLKQSNIGAEFLMPAKMDILVRLFPVLGRVRRPLSLHNQAISARDPQELRRDAFAALKELLTRVAARWPLVIIIDDLQWGDLDSAALLTELLSPPNAPAMMLIASYRSEEADSPLVSSLRAQIERAMSADSIAELEVGPLSAKDCRELVDATMQLWGVDRAAHERKLIDVIVRESAGSPFLVSELTRYLVDEEQAGASDARATERAVGSVTVEHMMATRRNRLDADARSVLDVLAVAGRPIPQGVILHAASLAAARHGVFDQLRAEHLIRTRGPHSMDAAECYHDRIRESVAALPSPDELRRIHLNLAQALEAKGIDDPEMLADYYLGADERERAAQYALAAADNAERALAFDRAARMLRMVIEIRPGDAEDIRALHIRLGDALANAGRGSESSEAFLAASAGAPEAQALDLRTRAAYQLLANGRIDDGLALLGEVLTSSKLHIPRTDHGALMSLALNRARLRLRGLHYEVKKPEEQSEHTLQLIDICWAGSVGLGVADPVRGADFGTRCLLMALKSGDETRIARTLAMEAAQLPTLSDRGVDRAEELAHMAAEIAERIDDKHALALSMLGLSSAALFSGRWRVAVKQARKAEASLRKHCTNVSWDLTTLRFFQLASLYYLGEWTAMHEDAAMAVRRALERGDRYKVASLVSYATFSHLAADDVDGARMTIREATVKWSLRGYHVQHYLNLMAHLFTDLYEGEGAKAWNRLQQEWPQMNRSLLKRVQLVRVEMLHGRARCALSHLAHSKNLADHDVEVLLKTANGDAKKMERERLAWATPLAQLVRGAVCAYRGQDRAAMDILDSAASALEAADMNLFAAAARWRLGELQGGDSGTEAIRAADHSMRVQGIANPGRVVDTLAPGFPAER